MPPLIEQAALFSAQVMPAGSVSSRVTPLAVPGPALLTVMSKAIGSPALTGEVDGLLDDGDVRAVHDDRVGGAVVGRPGLGLVGRRDGRRVGHGAADGRRGRPGDTHRGGRVLAQVAEVAGEDAALIEQAALFSVQVMPAGSVSVRVTPLAVPGPALLTVMSNAIGSPALTGDATAFLITVTSGHRTSVWAEASSEPSLVGGRRCRVRDDLQQRGGRRGGHVDGRRSATGQRGGRVGEGGPDSGSSRRSGSIDQVKAGFRLSVAVTPYAVPSPALRTVIAKPIGSPALTDAASAVLVDLDLGALDGDLSGVGVVAVRARGLVGRRDRRAVVDGAAVVLRRRRR